MNKKILTSCVSIVALSSVLLLSACSEDSSSTSSSKTNDPEAASIEDADEDKYSKDDEGNGDEETEEEESTKSSASASEEDESEIASVKDIDDLPECKKSNVDSIYTVISEETDYICYGKTKEWIPVVKSLPKCRASKEGVKIYATDEKEAFICYDEWEPLDADSDSGNSSGSKSDEESSSSSSKQVESSTSDATEISSSDDSKEPAETVTPGKDEETTPGKDEDAIPGSDPESPSSSSKSEEPGTEPSVEPTVESSASGGEGGNGEGGEGEGDEALDLKARAIGNLWSSNDDETRVITGFDDDPYEPASGFWFSFNDEVLGGNSTISFPQNTKYSEYYDYTIGDVIASYNILVGSFKLGNESPRVGVGFNLVSSDVIGADITNWEGLCLVYAATGATPTLEIAPEDEATYTEYNNYHVQLKTTAKPTLVNLPWDKFKQETGWGVTRPQSTYLTKVAQIIFRINGTAGKTGDFAIYAIGKLGSCSIVE